jgi:effector-binding domain-containing protein
MSAYAVQVQRLDATPLAVVRRHVRRSELARVVPECCGLVWNAVRAQQAPAGRQVAIYWDDGIHLEVGVELQGAFVERDGVVRSSTPAGLIASTTHYGPYTALGAAHDAIQQWCRAHHRQLAGPKWEIYGHWQSEWDADPAKIRTDVLCLIADGPSP